MAPILVVHQRAGPLVDALRARCPGERFVGVDRLDAVRPALDTHDPDIVFCIKTAAFTGEAYAALAHHRSVRWIHVGGSGTEHVGPWDPARVTVTHSAGVLAPYLTETWVGAVLALEGGLAEAARSRAWGERRFRSVRGQRLLVVGLGEVGSRVAALARALGMTVEGVRAHPERGGAQLVVGLDRLDERLAHADVVSLHLRLTPALTHLFDEPRLARIKPGALFVNTARGGLVDEAALVASLRRGHLRGAYLDVFEEEPLPPDSPLWSMDQVLVTPHAADQVEGWDLAYLDRFVAQLARHRAGRSLAHRACPPSPP